MARKLSLILAALVAVLAFWSWLHTRKTASVAAPPPVEAPGAPEPGPFTALEGALALPPAATEERVAVPPETAPEPDAAESRHEPEPVPERPDLAARDWLEILVQDPDGLPVFDAALSIAGIRKQDDPGAWYGMRGGPAEARTDAQGRARIAYVRWVDVDGRTGSVDLEVVHEDYVPFRDFAFPIGAGQHPVTLARGSIVFVAGWVGTPATILPDLVVHLDADAGLGQDAWRVERDGRLSTTRLAPGEHLMWLTHESAEHGKLASGFVAFDLRENDWEELSVELLPLLTLSGELERVVPRPVVDGHVMIDLHAGSTYGGSASISASFEAVVAPDGTFAIPDLPRASGQVIALCRGWVSRRTRATTLAEAGWYVENEPTPAEAERLLDEMGDRAFQAQRVTLPTHGPLVVAMEPTGTVEVTVTGPDGAPVAGAGVSASPNVFWVGVGSSLFPWGEWSATTDAEGVARLAGLPPDDALWITVTHGSLRLTRADRDRPPSVEVRSGDTTRVAIVLERAEQ